MNRDFRPWLIQLCTLRANQPKTLTGFDSVFECKYMGAAEFEFGSLPKSLRRITAALDDYKIRESGLKDHAGVPVFVICPGNIKSQALAVLPKLADGSHRLKECSYFEHNLKGDRDGYRRVDLWWDIGLDWFFCIGKPTADLAMMALRALRDRWAAEASK